MVSTREAEGVLLTGVYGSGKSSVAQEIAYLLEQRGEPSALLDLDYLSWAATGTGDRADEFRLMLQNMAAWRRTTAGQGSGCSCSPTLSAASARWAACGRRWGCRCGWCACRFRCTISSGDWPSTSPAAAATICVRRRHRSLQRRVLGSRMWSSATTAPSRS